MGRYCGFGRVVGVVVLLLTLGATPLVAQSPAVPAPSDPIPPGPISAAATAGPTVISAADTLESALLTADDLPDGFASDGVVEGSGFNFDQEAFDAHGGERVVSQVWNRSSDEGPIIVFDFRMAFPTPEDAAAYLDDAEATISEERASGLDLVPDAPAVGEHHRRYTGGTDLTGITLEFHNHLFTVGSVAAKVFVSTNAGGEAEAQRIAEAAAEHMAAAQSGTPAQTPAPTVAPSGGPDVSGIFEAVLLAHVVDGITDCQPEPQRAFVGELAAIACPIGTAGERLVMRQLDSTESLTVAFEPYTGSEPGDEGACQDRAALEPRSVAGERVGQLVCYDATDETRVFMWTDERFDILSWIVSAKTRPFDELYRQFGSAGPVALTEPGPSPSPTDEPSASGGPFPTDAEAALLSHIPEAIRDSCARSDLKSDASIAAIGCGVTFGGGSATITYQSYADAAAMDTGYQANLDFMGVERDTGPCNGDWPGEGTYNIGGEPAGHVACSEFGDLAQFISWTDDRLLIHGYVEGFGIAKDDLYQWWLIESGPV